MEETRSAATRAGDRVSTVGRLGLRPALREIMYGLYDACLRGNKGGDCHVCITETPLGERSRWVMMLAVEADRVRTVAGRREAGTAREEAAAGGGRRHPRCLSHEPLAGSGGNILSPSPASPLTRAVHDIPLGSQRRPTHAPHHHILSVHQRTQPSPPLSPTLPHLHPPPIPPPHPPPSPLPRLPSPSLTSLSSNRAAALAFA